MTDTPHRKRLTFHSATTVTDVANRIHDHRDILQCHAESRRMAGLMLALESRAFNFAVERLIARDLNPMGLHDQLTEFLATTERTGVNLVVDEVGFAWTVYLCRYIQLMSEDSFVKQSLDGTLPEPQSTPTEH